MVQKRSKYANMPAGGSSKKKGLNKRQRRIVELVDQGYSHGEVAHVMGCTPQTIYKTMKKPEAREYLADLYQTHMDEIVGMISDVVGRVRSALKSNDDELALKAIDRWEKLYSKLVRGDSDSLTVIMQQRVESEDQEQKRSDVLARLDTQLEDLRQRRTDLQDAIPESSEDVVDAEYEEIPKEDTSNDRSE